MQKFVLKNISDLLEGKFFGNEENSFVKITTDSRNLSSFNEVLFIAIEGQQHDGHKFISELYNKGVRSFILSKKIDFQKFPFASFVLVKNTVQTLQKLTALKRESYSQPLIAITGSNGKTIVKEWLHWILSPYFQITRSPKSYNSQIGVPLSLWLIDENTEIAIIEAGISKPGEMELLENIIKPNIGIITNIGSAHQANFNSQEHKALEKLKLFKNCDTVILNKENTPAYSQKDLLKNNKKIISWSFNGNSDVNIYKVSVKDVFSELCVEYKNKYFKLRIPFTDKGSIQNAISCFCVIIALDIEISDKLLNRFTNLPGVKMRLETVDGINNSIIINDAYNSDINSLEIALDYLNHKKGNKESMLVMSDILQSEKQEADLIKSVAKILTDKKVNHFIGIGQVLMKYQSLFPLGSKFYEDTDDFLEKSGLSVFYNKAVLLKAARDYKFEKISNLLQKKNHLSLIETDLNLIRHNLLYFKSIIQPETKLMVMVKAFSYGSGYREIASFLQYNRVDFLAVAFVDEGREIRQDGIETPIVVMNPNIHGIQTMIEYNLEPEIYSVSLLKEIIRELKNTDIREFSVHLKLDTGMHRLGLVKEDLPEFLKLVNETKKIKIASIFSHLSASDKQDFDDFTHQQAKQFNEMYKQIVASIGYKPDRHLLNSSGIVRFPEYQYEIVRLGIGLYGLMSELNNKLVPVTQFKSVISQIHHVKSTETVSYNRSGKLNRDSLIATVPVGYADGLDRRLGNGNWYFIVNGQKATVCGDICMDMCMVDITDISAKEYDEVIVFGPQNSILDMSDILKTIPYEVITGISPRIKRIYIEE
ncbi:MAG TPA: bifunctional UDP-N-acetylmuramoyl-tripeptide:D-alanyl-D-alanine ligase/alanine racemase [Bacteroidales bacterium]|nr:bifunctional UDP-N-acetylmuramoyl-tripeptide:D-alanyl-D-alanine ligase/alanine racemase [Bacteroidales bacterium]